jgi:hypothetical protein
MSCMYRKVGNNIAPLDVRELHEKDIECDEGLSPAHLGGYIMENKSPKI